MRAQLIDLSKWNAAWDPTGAEKKIDGVIMRASYGLVPDRLFETFYPISLSIPVRGVYHYFSSGSSWQDQAGFFLNQIEGKDIHFMVLDFERSYNHMSAEFTLDAGNWMADVGRRSQKRVLLYTNASTYDEWLTPYCDWMERWQLWIAQYPYRHWNRYLESIQTESTIKPGLPKGRHDWSIWQYSADGNQRGGLFGVKSRDVDINVYNGTPEELQNWAGIDSVTTVASGRDGRVIEILDDMQAVIDRHRRM